MANKRKKQQQSSDKAFVISDVSNNKVSVCGKCKKPLRSDIDASGFKCTYGCNCKQTDC